MWAWACSFPFLLGEPAGLFSGQSMWEVPGIPKFGYDWLTYEKKLSSGLLFNIN